MPAIRHGQAHWPGIRSVVSCTYTVSHGVSPGVAMLVCLPQPEPPVLSGNLVLTDGVNTITIPDCKIDRLDVVRDASGIVWRIAILDRRWRWRDLGGIAGYYNQPDPHGFYLRWTVKTPPQLIELCLKAMGETRYQIDVPSKALPPVNWDYTSPAQALQQLAEELGCRVIYRLDTDSVLVCPLGKGGSLPEGSVYAESPALDSPERPDSIRLIGAPIRYQARFRCQAVGRDWDGLYRPINALSYAPQGANAPDKKSPWRYVFGPGFTRFPETDRLTPEQAFDLARDTVYRCYQITNVELHDVNSPLTIPGTTRPLLRREQVILEDTKVEQIQPARPDENRLDADGQKIIKHFYDGFRRDVPAECYGSYFIGSTGNEHAVNKVDNSPANKKISVGFSIDPVWQVITFDEYVFKLRKDGGVDPADVILETGCLLRDWDTNQILRYEREYRFGPPHLGTKPLHIYHDDVAFNVIGDYAVRVFGENDQAEHRLRGVRLQSALGFGIDDTIRRSTHYLLGAAARYQLVGAHQRTYNGLEAIALDGRIQQVTWSVGEPGGAVTQASLNTEHSVYVPPYPQRLRAEFAPAPGRGPQPGGVAPPVPGAGIQAGLRGAVRP